ncbi:MAG: DNA-directed RNA polymerase subunit alpha [Sediminibacterium sp.]|nr:DNA-directed RNA polymerase subunit alpha [Sediminibacterium sp.]
MSILHFQQPDKIIFQKVTDFNATFEFRPLEPGYGVTVGNALRRVLLSSLEGIAIVGIKIDGVSHEFSTIPGITEDLIEIILNLKQIRFKHKSGTNSSSEKLNIIINNSTEFKASHIGEKSQYYDVINPDFVICTMEKSAKLNIDIHITKSRGYVSSEDNNVPDAPLGYIPIDSIHTPIVNVKYTIENYRVEQKTDYEKLIFELVTDGTIHPEEALKQASRILIKHLIIITDENITFDVKNDQKNDIVDEQLLQLKKVLKTSLEDLDLSVRAFNCLKTARINSLSELVQYEQEDLLKFRNFGQKSLSEIEEVLRQRGLSFGMDFSKLGLND